MIIETITTVDLTDEEKKTLRDAQQIIANILKGMEDYNCINSLLAVDDVPWDNLEVNSANNLLDCLAESCTIYID